MKAMNKQTGFLVWFAVTGQNSKSGVIGLLARKIYEHARRSKTLSLRYIFSYSPSWLRSNCPPEMTRLGYMHPNEDWIRDIFRDTWMMVKFVLHFLPLNSFIVSSFV